MSAIIQQIRHWFFLLPATLRLAWVFLRAWYFFRRKALRILDLPQHQELSSKEKRRFKHYFYGVSYLSAIFGALRGRLRTRRERERFTHLAALAYFFDDLVDAYRHGDIEGVHWLDNPEQYGKMADERGLALHFLQSVYALQTPEQKLVFQEYMHRVFNVEIRGRQWGNAEWGMRNAELGNVELGNAECGMGNAELGNAEWGMRNGELGNVELKGEIMRITAEKGGCSVLLFRSLLDNPISAPEEKALYLFGALIQLCDDIFDLWFDVQAGTVTAASTCATAGNIQALNELFETQVNACKTAIQKLPRPHLAWAMIFFLVAITRVCLQHYADLERQFGKIPLADRKLLVVDMERWTNRLRAAAALLLRR